MPVIFQHGREVDVIPAEAVDDKYLTDHFTTVSGAPRDARDNALLQEDRAIFLDARQWLGESSASLGRSGTKRRRTGRTATAFEMQSSSQDGT